MLNRFIGIGRWTKDVELKYTQAGKAVASSTIAIDDAYGNKDNTLFLPVVIWGKTAENTADYSGKGRLIAVEGRIQTRSWDSDNGKRYVTELIAENVRFLDKPKDQQQSNNDPFSGSGVPIDIDEDSLPF